MRGKELQEKMEKNTQIYSRRSEEEEIVVLSSFHEDKMKQMKRGTAYKLMNCSYHTKYGYEIKKETEVIIH